MPVFGWDASDFDWSRGSMDVGAAARDGIQFFTHKATEGTSLRHAHYGAALTRARDAGIPVLGAYHVVRSLGSLADQVKAYTAYLDEATPWWRSWPHWICQVDLELWPYDKVAGATGTAFADMLAQATGKTVVIYASKGQYGNSLGGSRPLWNAAYPSSTAGHYRELYPGDSGTGWQSYSGRVPIFWQYTSSATIGGQHGCDANAFRGTLDQLLTLTGGDDVSAHTDAVVAAWAVGVTKAADGTPVAPVDWEIRREAREKNADAVQAQILAAVAAPATVSLSQADRDAIIAGLAGLVPTVEEIGRTVDAAVKARLDGATVHTAGA